MLNSVTLAEVAQSPLLDRRSLSPWHRTGQGRMSRSLTQGSLASSMLLVGRSLDTWTLGNPISHPGRSP